MPQETHQPDWEGERYSTPTHGTEAPQEPLATGLPGIGSARQGFSPNGMVALPPERRASPCSILPRTQLLPTLLTPLLFSSWVHGAIATFAANVGLSWPNDARERTRL